MKLSRTLDDWEYRIINHPRKLANYHYSEAGGNANPYERGSLESLEYVDEFQKLLFREDKSL